jgi:hypothetical protein
MMSAVFVGAMAAMVGFMMLMVQIFALSADNSHRLSATDERRAVFTVAAGFYNNCQAAVVADQPGSLGQFFRFYLFLRCFFNHFILLFFRLTQPGK